MQKIRPLKHHKDIDALFAQGLHAHQLGHWQEAAALYGQVLQQQPQHAHALHCLGSLKLQQGLCQEAAHLLRQAAALNPSHSDSHYNLGNALKACGNLGEAAKALQQAIRLKPDYAEAYNDLGITAKRLGRLDYAIQCYQQAIRSKPRYVDAYYNLGIAFYEKGEMDAAIASYQQGLKIQPGDSGILNNLGMIYEERDQYDAAIKCYQKALRGAPPRAETYFNLGSVLCSKGRLEEAQAAYRKALQLNDKQAEAYHALARLKKFTRGDPDIQAMKKLLTQEGLDDNQRSLLNFALGKAYEDCQEYDHAFSCLERANRLRRASYAYSIDEDEQLIRDIRRVFDGAFFAKHRNCGEPAATPIFILGMPRSGTTLTEQILVSHPRVQGGGELRDLRLSLFTTDPHLTVENYPHAVPSLETAAFMRLAHDYLQRTARFANSAEDLVSDKMPVNFLYIGMIYLLFPNACVIHCRRDPIDTCLSCYKHYFSGHQPFAYDLAEVGRYYRLYERLMAHWHEVLPDFILDIQYEELVTDQEKQTRRLLAHCGLPWDEACLSFHKTERAVRTNSNSQVRRPLYRSAMQRWKHYESHLTPLLKILKEA